jgi:hypothetical protein
MNMPRRNEATKACRLVPGGITVAHPECPANIREHSDIIGGTEAMLRHVGQFQDPKDFFAATDVNMMWQMEKPYPRHRYHPVKPILRQPRKPGLRPRPTRQSAASAKNPGDLPIRTKTGDFLTSIASAGNSSARWRMPAFP